MANLFNCKFDTKPLKPALSKYQKAVEKLVKSELKAASGQIAAQAKANCSIPSIAATIRKGNDGEGFTVSAGQGLPDPEIAAYHEFGTGDFARSTVAGLPQDWSDYAWTFKKNGLGRLPASPYLYPAYNRVRVEIERNLPDKVNKL